MLVGSAHGVRALDPVTGEEAWHYTRSNARLCGLTADRRRRGRRVRHRGPLRRGRRPATPAPACARGPAASASPATPTLDSTDRDRARHATRPACSPSTRAATTSGGATPRPEGCRLLDADVGQHRRRRRCSAARTAPTSSCGCSTASPGRPHWTRDLPAAEGADVRLLGADGAVTVLVGDEVQTLAGPDGARAQPAAGARGDDGRRAVDRRRRLAGADRRHGVGAGRRDRARRLWEAPAIGLPAATGPRRRTPTPGRRRWCCRTRRGSPSATRPPAPSPRAPRWPACRPAGTASVVGPVVVYRLDDRVLGYR